MAPSEIQWHLREYLRGWQPRSIEHFVPRVPEKRPASPRNHRVVGEMQYYAVVGSSNNPLQCDRHRNSFNDNVRGCRGPRLFSGGIPPIALCER